MSIWVEYTAQLESLAAKSDGVHPIVDPSAYSTGRSP